MRKIQHSTHKLPKLIIMTTKHSNIMDNNKNILLNHHHGSYNINIFYRPHCDDNRGIFHVFEMQIKMSKFDHQNVTLLKQQWESPEKFRPEWGFKP